MKEAWYHTYPDDLWLKPDSCGSEEASFIKKALRLRRGQAVLDAPCGAGRIAIHLAHAGCVVTGVDLRESFTKRAAARFRAEGCTGHFAAMDLRELDFVDAFHGIFNWQGSFGYFGEQDNREVLQRYATGLRTGGRLLIDQPNREHLLRHFISRGETGDMIIRNRWDSRTQRVISTRTRGGSRTSMSIRLYTPRQLQRMYKGVGLRFEAIYGDVSGSPCHRSSRRMIMVGVQEENRRTKPSSRRRG